MKKLLPIFILIVVAIGGIAFVNAHTATADQSDTTTKAGLYTSETAEINWLSWEEAVKAMEKEPRKIVVDVYTEWCGYCKIMDKKTFTDPRIQQYINQHFYAVKLDAEQKEAIQWNDRKFEFLPNAGRRGVHTLAYSLLDGRMSYPSFVFLNEKFEKIMTSPGYKTPEQFLPELSFAQEEHYHNMSWDEYRNSLN